MRTLHLPEVIVHPAHVPIIVFLHVAVPQYRALYPRTTFSHTPEPPLPVKLPPPAMPCPSIMFLPPPLTEVAIAFPIRILSPH